MWPWVQIVDQVQEQRDTADRDRIFDTELGRLVTSGHVVRELPSILPDTGERFRLFERAGRLLAEVAAREPLLLVVDDLQWADDASLALFVPGLAPGARRHRACRGCAS